jgi:rubrerythrin
MHSEVDQLHTIGLLAAHEAAIADLYRLYADKLPDRKEFFEGLADDEVDHARQIVSFAGKVKAGSISVNPGRFSEETILASLDYVREQIREQGKTAFSPVEALSTAAGIENAMIEKRFFEIVEGDGPEIKQLLRGLAAATAAHRARLLQECEKEKEGEG